MASVKTWNGLAVANLKTFNGLAKANVKTINGLGMSTLKNGLVACYEHNETSGTSLVDAYASLNGTIVGSASLNQTGKIGSCINYNIATTSYADLSARYANLATTYGTFSGWINVNDSYTRQILLSRYFQINAGEYQFNANGAGSYVYNSISNGWKHIVYTRDTDNNTRLYINGSLVNTWSSSYFYYDGYSYLFLGANNLDGSPAYSDESASIDQCAFWNRALTASEISQLYNSGNGLAYTSW